MEPPEPTLTRVVFRIWPDDEVLALFPELPGPGKVEQNFCLGWSLPGGDREADYPWVLRRTRPATKEEYWHTHVVLERMGYRLKICRKISYVIHANRRRAWRQLMKETRYE